MGTDWGSVPDWAQAIGTTGALIYIGFQYHRDRSRDLRQREVEAQAKLQTERLRRDAEAAQARLVSTGQTFELGETVAWIIAVHNDSDRIIRDVRLSVENPTGRELLPAGSHVTPSGMIFAPANDTRIGEIGPAQLGELRFEFEGSDVGGGHDPLPYEGCSWSVTFTDATGIRWRRRGESGVAERIIVD